MSSVFPRPMPNAEDEHRLALHPIAQDVWPDDRQLPSPLTRISASVWELPEAVGKFDQPLGQASGRGGIIDGNVDDDRLEMLDRLVCPDDLRQISRRRAASGAACRGPRIAASGA